MKKEITEILINNRSIKFGDLIHGTYGIDLKSKHKTFPELVVILDEIIHILDHFENQGYIEIKRYENNGDKGSRFFEGIPVEIKNEKAEITANKLHWFVKEIQNRYLWEIIIKSGLINYRQNGYRTDKQVEWRKQIILSVGAVILTSLLGFIASWIVQSFNAEKIFLIL